MVMLSQMGKILLRMPRPWLVSGHPSLPAWPTQDGKGLNSSGQSRPTPRSTFLPSQQAASGGLLCFFFSSSSSLSYFKKHMSLAITHALIIIMTICLMGCNKTTANLALLTNLSPLLHSVASPSAPEQRQHFSMAELTWGKGRVNSVIHFLSIHSFIHSSLIIHHSPIH